MLCINFHYHFFTNTAVPIGVHLLLLTKAVNSSISAFNLCITYSMTSQPLLAFDNMVLAINPSRQLPRLSPFTLIMASWVKIVLSGSWGCGLYISVSSTETIFVNEAFIFKFHGFLYETHYRKFLHICFGSCYTNNWFHSGRQSPLCAKSVVCSFPEGSMCLSNISTPTTLGFIAFGYFCIAAVITVFHKWSIMCSEVQIFMVLVALTVLGWG